MIGRIDMTMRTVMNIMIVMNDAGSNKPANDDSDDSDGQARYFKSCDGLIPSGR